MLKKAYTATAISKTVIRVVATGGPAVNHLCFSDLFFDMDNGVASDFDSTIEVFNLDGSPPCEDITVRNCFFHKTTFPVDYDQEPTEHAVSAYSAVNLMIVDNVSRDMQFRIGAGPFTGTIVTRNRTVDAHNYFASYLATIEGVVNRDAILTQNIVRDVKSGGFHLGAEDVRGSASRRLSVFGNIVSGAWTQADPLYLRHPLCPRASTRRSGAETQDNSESARTSSIRATPTSSPMGS